MRQKLSETKHPWGAAEEERVEEAVGKLADEAA